MSQNNQEEIRDTDARAGIAALAMLGARFAEEIAAYRPAAVFVASPAEIIGNMAEEIADLRAELATLKASKLQVITADLMRWNIEFKEGYARLEAAPDGALCYFSHIELTTKCAPTPTAKP